MSVIVAGRSLGLAVLIIVVGAILLYLRRAEAGRLAKIRRLPQID